MKLCLELLRSELPYTTTLAGTDVELVLSRHAFLRAEVTPQLNTLYMAHADALQHNTQWQEASALVCIGKPSDAVLSAAVPVLIVEEAIELVDLSNAIGDVFARYDELEDTLNRILRTGSLQELVDAVTPFFGNVISIADSSHMMLALSYNQNAVISQAGLEQTKNNLLPAEVITFFKNNKRWQEVRSFTEPFIYDEGIFDYRLLCVNILDEDEFICRVMINETEHPFRPYDSKLLTYFAEYVRWFIENTLVTTHDKALNDLADLLLMQLSGVSLEPWRFEHALAVRNYRAGARYQCVCIRLSDGDYSTNTVHYYCGLISRHFRGVTVFEYKDDIVCLMNLDYYENSQHTLLSEISLFIRDNNFRAGMSVAFEDVSRFEDYHHQAETALNYGLSQIPSQWIHRYEQCAMECIVWKVSANSNIRALCNNQILALYDYDKEHGGAYVSTVEAYFNNHLNAQRTSRALGIHRATMIYRLERIKALSGITFENADKNLQYHFSIKLLRYIEAHD